MGTITVNISDETEELFRAKVRETNGKDKGTLGKAIDEALKKWALEHREDEVAKRQISLSQKGFRFGRYTFKRDELYGR